MVLTPKRARTMNSDPRPCQVTPRGRWRHSQGRLISKHLRRRRRVPQLPLANGAKRTRALAAGPGAPAATGPRNAGCEAERFGSAGRRPRARVAASQGRHGCGHRPWTPQRIEASSPPPKLANRSQRSKARRLAWRHQPGRSAGKPPSRRPGPRISMPESEAATDAGAAIGGKHGEVRPQSARILETRPPMRRPPVLTVRVSAMNREGREVRQASVCRQTPRPREP